MPLHVVIPLIAALLDNGPSVTPPAITRETLAAAYLAIDAAYQKSVRDDARTAELNRRFDAATLRFFSGQQAEVLAMLREFRWDIEPPSDAALPALGAVAQPRVVVPGGGQAVLTIAPMMASSGPLPKRIAVRLRHPEGAVIGLETIDSPSTEAPRALPIELPAQGPFGRWAIEVSDAAAEAPYWLAIGVLRVAPEAPSATVARLGPALEAIGAAPEPARPELAQALATAKARLRLLRDDPSTVISAQFLADPASLARSLEQEVEALTAGRNPYASGTGDVWRVVRALDVDMPLRLVVPEGLPDRPGLVIALHGAGGDESMFVDGYGQGRIVDLAARHGFILASPSTTTMMISPAFLDALIDTLVAERGIDPAKVHLIGHSMGAAAAARLASQRPDRIASYVCLAGGGALPREGPRGLVIGAALDPIIPAAGLRRAVEQARERGAPVEYRERPHHGHTFIVNDALEEVFEWIAAQTPNRAPDRTPDRAPDRAPDRDPDRPPAQAGQR